MTKYGQIATTAAQAARSGADPVSAWKEAAQGVFPKNKPSREKGCPKYAFLGLAEDGLIKGVAAGNYTTSQNNKQYAIRALCLIRADCALAKNKAKLWNLVVGGAKQHNEQLDVVIDLWKNGDV